MKHHERAAASSSSLKGKLWSRASTQGDAVRVSNAKKDTLQEMIALVRKSVTDIPLQFMNFRD